ncbi:MAG: type II toxin-antitoxin system HicA family toxin, partial [Pseudomonadota bacterium]
LTGDGFVLVSVRGSHHKYRKANVVIIVPHPKKDLPIGTARAIAKAAGWI